MPPGHFPTEIQLSASEEAMRKLREYFPGKDSIGFHASFEDFLSNESRSGPFYVNVEETRALFAKCCIDVMNRHLRFNIANIATSFLPTKLLPHIP